MLTSDPKLPQLYGTDAGEFVSVSFYRRFQERFYNLWRELALLVNRLVQGPSGATDNQVARFSGSSGALVKASDIYITDDGRLYGTALHNNAGAVTGTTNQYVASGTYTPTLTSNSNVASSSVSAAQWMRVGNVVTVSGYGTVDPTNAAFCSFGLSLPVASNFTGANHLNGAGAADNLSDSSLRVALFVSADSTNDRATLQFVAGTADNHAFSFTFTYVVL